MNLDRTAKRAKDLRPVLHWAADRAEKDTKKRFDRKGAFDGVNRWPQLAPSTIRRKAVSYPGTEDMPLVRTGRLKKATQKHRRGHVRRVNKKSAEVGVNATSFPYAADHQEGRVLLPQRQFLFWGPKSNRVFKKKMQAYVSEGKRP